MLEPERKERSAPQPSSIRLPESRRGWGGLLVVGLIVGLAAQKLLPKVATKARLAVRSATGTTYRSGVPGTARATADPASGRPA